MKKSLAVFKDSFEESEEKISKFEDQMLEMTNSEEHKENRLKKSEKSLTDLWYTK